MENHLENKGWMSVPQFGGWDQKAGALDYSMVFSRARANRKHHKSELRPRSIANEQELMGYQRYEDDEPPMKGKKSLRYLCCMMP